MTFASEEKYRDLAEAKADFISLIKAANKLCDYSGSSFEKEQIRNINATASISGLVTLADAYVKDSQSGWGQAMPGYTEAYSSIGTSVTNNVASLATTERDVNDADGDGRRNDLVSAGTFQAAGTPPYVAPAPVIDTDVTHDAAPYTPAPATTPANNSDTPVPARLPGWIPAKPGNSPTIVNPDRVDVGPATEVPLTEEQYAANAQAWIDANAQTQTGAIGDVPNAGGRGAVDPTPGGSGATQPSNGGGQAASAPAQTPEEQQATFYAKLGEAQTAAKNGDSQALRNFDSFFSITRPEAEYTQAFYQPSSRTDQVNALNVSPEIKSQIILEIQSGNQDTVQNLSNWFSEGKPPSSGALALGGTSEGRIGLANAMDVSQQVKNQIITEIQAGNQDTVQNLANWFNAGKPPSAAALALTATPPVPASTVAVAPDPFAGGPADASAGAPASQAPESTTVTAEEKAALVAASNQPQSYPSSADDIMPKAVEAAQRVISDPTLHNEPSKEPLGGTVAGGSADPYTPVVPPAFSTKP